MKPVEPAKSKGVISPPDVRALDEMTRAIRDTKERLDAAHVNKTIVSEFGSNIPRGRQSRIAKVTFQDEADFEAGFLSRNPDEEQRAHVHFVDGETVNDRIFIRRTTDPQREVLGNLYHEYIHFYAHDNFLKEFVSREFREGFTEYFTRQALAKDGFPPGMRTDRSVYYKNIGGDTIGSFVASRVGDVTLRKAYFGGDAASIQAVKKVVKEEIGEL